MVKGPAGASRPAEKREPSMDSAELRARQQPLKDAYREDPEQAVVTLRARGQLDDGISCSVDTGRALAVAGLHPATGGTVTAEGDLDFRGTLAVSKEAPVGFRSIRLAFQLDTDASEEQVQTLIRLTERYCVVFQTLANPAELSVSA